jgi:branched-chain amino acid transport system substrate-binding protein
VVAYHSRIIHIFTSISIFVALVPVLSACNQPGQAPTSSQNKGPIKIGISLSLSGDFSSDGSATKQGYQLWADTINKQGGLLGRQVQLIILNDNSKPNQTATNYQKLISVDHVDLIVGPFADDFTIEAGRIADRQGYALIEGTGVAPTDFQQNLHNLFAVSLSAKNTLLSFANYILALPPAVRPKTAVYATQQDPYLQPIVEEAKARLEAGGVVTRLDEQTYPSETTDYKPIADKLIQANADIAVLGTGTPDAIAFVERFRQQHYNPKALVEVSGPDQGSQFSGPIGIKSTEGIFVPNGGWFPGIKSYQNAQFVQAYIARYGGTADSISGDSAQAYSVMQVLEQAVNKIHSVDNASLIKELHADTFNTLQGSVKFAPDGENAVAVPFLFQWQKGQLLPVYPSDSALAAPEYPKAQWPS